ncbi:response regulator [Ramlibacter sp. AW1]|uniref:Response regulator n=1 Tax=Ramlibacter aurantiacus TaxID=2801330 RepID=A0A937D4J6_9BURK|nr:response regulator [Ramlibacter aurantiacus]MBL0418958.1 response regulator [Ramlibacter aurantiacus]
MNAHDSATSVPPLALPPVDVVLDALPHGLGLFDAEQRLVRCNAAFATLLRLPAESVRPGIDFQALVEATRRAPAAGAQPAGLLLMDGRPPPQPRRVERLMADGTLLEVHLAALPAGGLAVGLQDIGNQRQNTEALRRTRAQNEQLMAMVRQLRTGAATGSPGDPGAGSSLAAALKPLAGTLARLLLGLESAGLRDRAAEWVAQADELAHSLLRVLEDLSPARTGQPVLLQLEPRPFELEQLLRELSAAYAALLGDAATEFLFDIDPRLPPRLVGDDRRLRQVLTHLGLLLISAAGDRPRQLRVLLAGRSEDAVRIGFTLHGPGEAVSGDTALDDCRQVLQLMDSELRLLQEPSLSGFAFELALPLDRSAAVVSGPLSTPGLNVLVADSRPATREALVRLGQALGWHMHEAANRQQMLDTLRTIRPSALLVHERLEGSPRFAAAFEAADALVGRPLAPVLLGSVSTWGALASLSDAQRRKLGTCLCMPPTAAMMAEGVERAQALLHDGSGTSTSGTRMLEGMRVLLAEDNPSNQIVTRDLLLAQGAQVEIAVDGVDTLTSLVANGRYDAILMDWQMPNMDGLETTREIRQIVGFENIPIIALTASASASDRDACLAAGMNAHLAKPVDAGELVATLRRHAKPSAAADGVRRPAAAPAAPRPPASRIEREAAIARLGGDSGLYERVLERFRGDLPRDMVALEEAWRRGDRSQSRRLAHTLKGSAGTVGAQQLAQAAKQFEALLAGPASGAEPQAWGRLREAAEATLKALG